MCACRYTSCTCKFNYVGCLEHGPCMATVSTNGIWKLPVYCYIFWDETGSILWLSVPFPAVSILYKLVSVLSVSSADCERGFSVQNIIKTHKRSCLKTTTLQHLQLIKLEGPSLNNFDFTTALSKCKAKKDRRNKQ